MPRGQKKVMGSPVMALAEQLSGVDEGTLGLALEIAGKLRAAGQRIKAAVAKVQAPAATPAGPAPDLDKVFPKTNSATPIKAAMAGKVSHKKKGGKPAAEMEAAPVTPAPRTGLLGRKLGGRGKGAE